MTRCIGGLVVVLLLLPACGSERRSVPQGSVLILRPNGGGSLDLVQELWTAGPQRDVAIGDLDGDGRAEIVACSFGHLDVLAADATGLFSVVHTYDVTGGTGLVLEDLNGDGHLDVAVAGAGEVSVWIGDGAGSFDSLPDLDARDASRSIRTGDVDGDGLVDLVVTPLYVAQIAVLHGLGGGRFDRLEEFSTPPESFTFDVAVVDLDGDGRDDIVTANGVLSTSQGEAPTGSLSVFLTRATGGLGPRIDYPAGSTASVVAVDLDGDGALDLASAEFDRALATFHGNGDGVFLRGAPIAAGDYALILTLADINGDGRADLVANHPGRPNVRVLANGGDGTFTETMRFARSAAPDAPLIPWTVATGDLDGDGTVELVVANAGFDNAFY